MLERTGTFSKAKLLSTSNIENETFGKSIVQDNNPKKVPPKKVLSLVDKVPGFYPSTLVHSRMSQKIQFLDCLLSSVASWGGLMLDIEGKYFEI